MNIKRTHHRIVAGEVSLFFGIILAFLLHFIGEPAFITVRKDSISCLVQLLIALLLILLNNEFVIIKRKTYLPTILFLLFVSYHTGYYDELRGSIAAGFLLISLFFILNSYQKENSQFQSFNVSMFLAIASIFWSPMLFLFPVVWYGFYKLMSFNAKTILSSLFGIASVYLFLTGWCLYTRNFSLIFQALPGKESIQLHPLNFSVLELIVWSYTLIILVISGINSYMFGLSERIRTVKYLQYLFSLSLYILILLLFRSDIKDTFAIIFYIPASLVISHYFTTNVSKFSLYFLAFSILFYIAAFTISYLGIEPFTRPIIALL